MSLNESRTRGERGGRSVDAREARCSHGNQCNYASNSCTAEQLKKCPTKDCTSFLKPTCYLANHRCGILPCICPCGKCPVTVAAGVSSHNLQPPDQLSPNEEKSGVEAVQTSSTNGNDDEPSSNNNSSLETTDNSGSREETIISPSTSSTVEVNNSLIETIPVTTNNITEDSSNGSNNVNNIIIEVINNLPTNMKLFDCCIDKNGYTDFNDYMKKEIKLINQTKTASYQFHGVYCGKNPYERYASFREVDDIPDVMVYVDLNRKAFPFILFWEISKTFVIKEEITHKDFMLLLNSNPKWIWLKNTYKPPITSEHSKLAADPIRIEADINQPSEETSVVIRLETTSSTASMQDPILKNDGTPNNEALRNDADESNGVEYLSTKKAEVNSTNAKDTSDDIVVVVNTNHSVDTNSVNLVFEHEGNITDLPVELIIPEEVIRDIESQCSVFDDVLADPYKYQFREVVVGGHKYKYWNYYYDPSNVTAKRNYTELGTPSRRIDFINRNDDLILFKLQLKGCCILRQKIANSTHIRKIFYAMCHLDCVPNTSGFDPMQLILVAIMTTRCATHINWYIFYDTYNGGKMFHQEDATLLSKFWCAPRTSLTVPVNTLNKLRQEYVTTHGWLYKPNKYPIDVHDPNKKDQPTFTPKQLTAALNQWKLHYYDEKSDNLEVVTDIAADNKAQRKFNSAQKKIELDTKIEDKLSFKLKKNIESKLATKSNTKVVINSTQPKALPKKDDNNFGRKIINQVESQPQPVHNHNSYNDNNYNRPIDSKPTNFSVQPRATDFQNLNINNFGGKSPATALADYSNLLDANSIHLRNVNLVLEKEIAFYTSNEIVKKRQKRFDEAKEDELFQEISNNRKKESLKMDDYIQDRANDRKKSDVLAEIELKRKLDDYNIERSIKIAQSQFGIEQSYAESSAASQAILDRANDINRSRDRQSNERNYNFKFGHSTAQAQLAHLHQAENNMANETFRYNEVNRNVQYVNQIGLNNRTNNNIIKPLMQFQNYPPLQFPLFNTDGSETNNIEKSNADRSQWCDQQLVVDSVSSAKPGPSLMMNNSSINNDEDLCNLEGNYFNSGTWFKIRKVTANNNSNAFNIEYEDGDTERDVTPSRIRKCCDE